MRKYFLLLISLIMHSIIYGQKTISGVVKDTKSHPLTGVSISLKDTYDGATSDSSGRFVFKTLEKGNQVLVATAIGYRAFERTINLDTSSAITISLKEEISELKAVVISAGSFEAGDRKKGTVLNSIDILTTANANADISAAMKTLPGAQQVGESEGLFVRGGTAAETKFFMDGALVNNFFYSSVPNVAQRGRFSPWFLKGAVFSTGGYSALYGQALSSALIMETLDLPDQSSGTLGLSFLNASGSYQRLSRDKKKSWGVSYAYTDLSLAFKLIKQRQDFFRIPVYHTADANFRIKTSSTGIIKYYGYFSTNQLGFTERSIDTIGFRDAFDLSNNNMYHNLSYRESLGSGWKLNAALSFTTNKDEIEGHLQNNQEQKVILPSLEFKNFRLHSNNKYGNARVVLEKKLNGLSALRFGSEYNYTNENPAYYDHNGGKNGGVLTDHLSAAFAEGDVYLTNNIAAKLGSRLEYSSLLQKSNLAPRISFAYKLKNSSQLSVAYGILYQNPESRYFNEDIDLGFSKATHYIAQFQKLTGERTIRAELFYKKYDDLVKTVSSNGRELAVNNQGYGYAKGFDFFWRDRKSIKGVDYWFSYSFLDTEREFQNYPHAIWPNYVAKHTASLVVKKFVTALKTQFNASYTYASGRPYYNIRFNNSNNKFTIRDQGKTIDLNSLSISVNYLPNVFKEGAGKYSVFVFSITNALVNKQIYGYKYSYNDIRKEAIVPPSKVFLFLGAFISFGVDRSEDVINSNL
jgi:vitamin B12 transporter